MSEIDAGTRELMYEIRDRVATVTLNKPHKKASCNCADAHQSGVFMDSTIAQKPSACPLVQTSGNP